MTNAKQQFAPTHQIVTEYRLRFEPGEVSVLDWVEKLRPIASMDEWAEDWWSTPPTPKKPFRRSDIPLGALAAANPKFLKL